jgi:hypothetical protein
MRKLRGLVALAAAAVACVVAISEAPAQEGPVRVAQAAKANLACCRQANAECLSFCRANPSRAGCEASCQSMDNGCRNHGTYDWQTRPATNCRVAASLPAAPALRAFCNKQNSACTGSGCTANPGSYGKKHCQEVVCGGRLATCLQTGCYQWSTKPASCFAK